MLSETNRPILSPSAHSIHSGAASPVPGAGNLDMALDVLGEFLREYGRCAFDLPEAKAHLISDLCEKWSQHILYATPPPEDYSHELLTGGKRDWNGLRQFLFRHRQQENDYVKSSLSGLNQIFWTLIEELNNQILGDQQTDSHVQRHLDRLRTAVEGNSLEEIKREVLSSVSSIGDAMEERKRRQQDQMDALTAQIKELCLQLEAARQENVLDPLTQLYNRRALDEQLKHTIELCRIFQEPACFFLVDADAFKKINDTYGHPAGDAVLKALSNCLMATFPSRGDFIARYGGEEFGIVFQDTTLVEGRKLGERLLSAVRALQITHEGREIPITVSIGLADFRPEDTPQVWLERTDRALYRAKENGRDRLEEA